MEQQSDKLRFLLEQVKYDAPQTLLADLVTHIAEDDSYAFFRYVQDLLEYRRIDALLLENEELWSQVRTMYWERFPWLIRHDLKYGPDVPEERERNRRLEQAVWKASKGVPGDDYKEDWITEYLKSNGLNWEDVANGRHLRMEIPETGYTQFPDPATLLFDPRAGMMGLTSRAMIEHELDTEMTEDGASSTGHDGGSLPPSEQGTDDEDPEPQGAIAMMVTVEEPLTPDGSLESSEVDPETPGDSPEKGCDGQGLETPGGALQTPDDSGNNSKLLSPVHATTVMPSPPKDPPPKPVADPDWLMSWHKATRNGKAADFQQQPYKGWLISGPVLSLKRIANFLSDEDIDRTPDWANHVAEITEYLAYLIVNYYTDKHSWGYELREAIEMLHTHVAFEDYHYGKPPLTLRFDETPLKSERLPHVAGSNIAVGPRMTAAKDPLAPRDLLHRLPEGVWDAMYGIPIWALHDPFLKELRTDEKHYWKMVRPDTLHNRRPAAAWRLEDNGRGIKHEWPYGFNMCEMEDNTFISCMQLGPLRTYQELKGPCSFGYRAEEHEESGDIRSRKNRQLLQFSKFRGANRAALTFALRTLGSQTREIKAVRSPWRKLVVRTLEQREKKKPHPGVIWQSAELGHDQIPKGEFDPMAYNFWHNMLLENRGSWAKAKIPDVEEARKELVGANEAKYPPAPKTNFKGPYTVVEVNEERYNNEKFLKRLERTLRDLETAARLSPRPILKEVLINARWGRRGLPAAKEEKDMFPDDVVDQREDGKKEVRIMEDDDVDLELLERMSHVSINDMMLKLVPKEWSPRKRIFADRVQALVADISTASIFASAERQATLEQVVVAVNASADGPVKGAWYAREEAIQHLNDLETFKRISITRTGAEPTYSRPGTTIHPEQTFHWDFALSARPRSAPTYLSYEALAELEPITKRMNSTRTTPLLKGTAWRLGKTIRCLEQTLASQPGPTAAQRAALRNTYRDLTRNWERKVETWCDNKGTRQVMDYRDVIRYAEPGRFRSEWASDDAQVEEGDVLGPVYAGILREAHENKSMLWPSRWRRVASETGEKIVWSRDGVWSWARPDVRQCWRYFHVRRWPVNLQRDKMQERITKSGERGKAVCVVGKREEGVCCAGRGIG